MNDLSSFLGYISAAAIVLGATLRWLIAKYFEKHQELETYKERAMTSQVNRLKTITEETVKDLRLLRTDILEHAKVLARHQEKLGGIEREISSMQDLIRPFSQALARKRARELEAEAMQGQGATKISPKKAAK